MVMGIGDWGLGIGDWGLAQSPIPNHKPNLLLKFRSKYFKLNLIYYISYK